MHYNQQFAAWLALILFAAFVVTLILVGRLPQYKGKEIGKVFMHINARYPISIFFIFIFVINLAEAALAASIIDDNVNPVARFLTHNTMALISIAAGMVWTKEIYNFSQSFVAKPFSFGDVLTSFGLVAITTTLAVFLPILNMAIIANGLRQTIQVSIFSDWIGMKMGFINRFEYVTILSEYGLPPTYSAWQGMSAPMIATLGVTFVHMALLAWEALKMKRMKDKDMFEALMSDVFEKKDEKKDKKEDKKDGAKDEDKKDDKEKKEEKSPYLDNLSYLISYLGTDKDEVPDIISKIKKARSYTTRDQQVAASEAFGELRVDVDVLENEKSSDGMSESDYRRRKHEIQDKIRNQFRKSPSNGGFGITLPKPKN